MTGKSSGYPYLFIVRSDGETLYGNGGLTSQTDLIPLMESALETSGRILNVREAETLSKAAEQFQYLSESGDTVGAIKALSKAGRIGTPGQIPSYADSAVKVNMLVKGMATEVMTKLQELDSAIESGEPDERVEAILASMQLTSDYGGLKVLRPEITKFKKKLGKNKELSQLIKEAKVITTAVSATSKTAKKRAVDNLQKLIDSSEIDKIKGKAQAVLDDLKPQIQD